MKTETPNEPNEVELTKVNITEHAYDRARERLSLSKNSIERLAEKAFEIGLQHSKVKGSLKRYLDKLALSHRDGGNKKPKSFRIYGEVIYLFSQNNLITLYQLPNNLRKYIKFSNAD